MSRIIAGSRRGRRLTMPSGSATRPTSDRVREAVFTAIVSWLGTADEDPSRTLAGIAFADCYAGSGAVGLEAASRGAGPVLLVEKDRRTAILARTNGQSLDLTVTVLAAGVESTAAGSAASPYDIIWLDPPYELATERVDAVLADLVDHGWLAEDGLLVVERSTRTTAPSWPAGFTGWTKKYGDTEVHFGHR